tara:strand:- start:500 stop:1855 length:1356 start_codon:yes stop_codon:yes gene_type:complete
MRSSVRKLRQIRPTNIGKNEWSFKEGTPQIEFNLSKNNEIIVGRTLRLNGIFSVRDSTGKRPSNNTLLVNKPTAHPSNVLIDSRIGIQSVLENVTINNATTGRNYEIVKHYNRMVASTQPKQTSQANYIGGGVDINGATGKQAQTGNLLNRQINFSLPIQVGMLKKNLDLNVLGGLNIVLDLASDSFVLFDTNYDDITDVTATNASYKLRDLVLTYDAILPTGQALQEMSNIKSTSFAYPSFSSYYTTLVSQDSNHIFNLNSSATLSVLMNFIPSKWVNNFQRNSCLCVPILNDDGTGILKRKAKLKDVTFLRNNQKYPLDFTIPAKDLLKQSNNPNPFVLYEDINSMKVASKNVSTLLAPVNVRGFGNVRPNASEYFPTSNAAGSQLPIFSLGMSYDHIKNMGVSFKNAPFGFRIRSQLVDGVDNPHSVYLFVKQVNQLSVNNGVIQVMS